LKSSLKNNTLEAFTIIKSCETVETEKRAKSKQQKAVFPLQHCGGVYEK
jgi:hypothetical protein